MVSDATGKQSEGYTGTANKPGSPLRFEWVRDGTQRRERDTTKACIHAVWEARGHDGVRLELGREDSLHASRLARVKTESGDIIWQRPSGTVETVENVETVETGAIETVEAKETGAIESSSLSYQWCKSCTDPGKRHSARQNIIAARKGGVEGILRVLNRPGSVPAERLKWVKLGDPQT